MLIRPTEEADWHTLKTIRLAALRDAPTAFGVSHQAASADSDDRWRQRASPSGLPEFWLALDGATAVGLVGAGVDQQGRYNLIAMWVAPEQRGSQAARRLVDAVKARAVARGHARVVLDVSPDNGRAAGFYQREGFVFLDEWEPLASHPEIRVQRMEWMPAADHASR
jgi:ribosomal protein S18 acetylase RimI-like enzyme